MSSRGGEPRSCPACAAPWRSGRAAYRQGEWAVHRCGLCGTGVTVPRPDERRLLRAYEDPAYYEERGIHHAGILPDHREKARLLRERTPGHRVLEIGCGEGYLLAALRDLGLDVRGCEISEAAAAQARSRFDLRVHPGTLDTADFPAACFDLVLLYHVLEHVADPGGLLAGVRRVLGAGGLAVVEVPNFASPQMLRPGMRRKMLDLPVHLAHFTPGGLRLILERAGFQVEELAIPFGPPLAPLLTVYERLRGAPRMGSKARASQAPPPRPASGTAPPAPAGLKTRLLAVMRKLSAAHKMTAYARRPADEDLR